MAGFGRHKTFHRGTGAGERRFEYAAGNEFTITQHNYANSGFAHSICCDDAGFAATECFLVCGVKPDSRILRYKSGIFESSGD